MNTSEHIAKLQTALPDWYFKPYGSQGAVAAFPPSDMRPHTALAWDTVGAHARVTGLCGPFLALDPELPLLDYFQPK